MTCITHPISYSDCKHRDPLFFASLVLGVQELCHHTQLCLFNVNSGDCTHVLLLEGQTVSLLSHFPSPCLFQRLIAINQLSNLLLTFSKTILNQVLEVLFSLSMNFRNVLVFFISSWEATRPTEVLLAEIALIKD